METVRSHIVLILGLLFIGASVLSQSTSFDNEESCEMSCCSEESPINDTQSCCINDCLCVSVFYISQEAIVFEAKENKEINENRVISVYLENYSFDYFRKPLDPPRLS